jgi:hypothetical protein
MRVDPAVVRQKYDRELARLHQQRSDLEKRGIVCLSSSSFPIIEILYVHRWPVEIIIPVMQQGGLSFSPIQSRRIKAPSLGGSAFKARFDLSDYDLDPPSLEFRDPWTNDHLQYDAMFRAYQFDSQRKSHLVLLGDHPDTHKPFLCVRGIREYHHHPQHSGDEWLLYRDSMNMFSIILSLWRVAVDLSRPILDLHKGQVEWVGEEKL